MKLEGIKIIELAQFLPGPHLTMMMADHGAEVIKIEPWATGEPARTLGLTKGGDSVWFRNTHRGKRSLRLNLKDARGREVLLKLCEGADVLVESFRPGVVERLGIGYETVAKRAPQIIYCSLSAFGQTSRYRNRPAHDIAMQALAGILSLNLGQDGKPACPATLAADMSGSLMAFGAILMALLRQRQTGQGDYIDISMHDSLISWTPTVTGPVFAEHRPNSVRDERNWGGAAFYNIYETKDGKYMVLGGVEHKFCENFLHKAGRPDLIPLTLQPPGPMQEPVKDYLRRFFIERTQQEALDWLEGTDICYAPLRNLYEGFFDPNTREREMLLLDEEGNEHIGVPIKFRNEPAQPNLQLPRFGEHSTAILRHLGYGDTEIQQLAQEGVI